MSTGPVTITDALAYAPIMASTLSPSGRFVAVITPAFDALAGATPPVLRLLDLAHEDAGWQLLGHPQARFHGPVFSPDDRLAAFRSHGDIADIVVFSPGRLDAPAVDVVGMPPGAMALKWFDTPGRLACIGLDGMRTRRLWIWDDLAARPRVCTPPRLRVDDYAFAHGSRRLAWLHQEAPTVGQGEPVPTLHVVPDVRKPRASAVLPTPEPILGYLSWSPDGRWLVGLGRPLDTLVQPRLWLLSPDTGEARRLLPQRTGWITAFDWTPDSRALVVSLEEGVEGRLVRVDVDGVEEDLPPHGTFVNGAKLDRGDGRMLLLRQDGDEPQHVRLREPGATTDRRISSFSPTLRTRRLQPQETVRWSRDGQTVEALLMMPEGVERPPVVVWLHGGPAEHLQRTFSAYFQILSAEGWAVLAPNYRGSTARGDAFLQSLVGRMLRDDVDDVLAGLDALSDRLDVARAAFIGWSYGGSLALRCGARADARAVVAGSPVADWVTVFGARSWPHVTPRYFGVAPWEDPGPYDAASPIRTLSDLASPTLLLHGELDDRVPVSQSRVIYRFLQARGVPADLRLFPGEGHVFASPWAVREMLARVVAWLRTHL